MNILKNILLGLLLLFTVFFICRCLMALGAVIFDSHIRFRAQQREAFLRPQRDRRYMPLSVLVMAGTEPQALLATLDSLQKQAYPLYEIIVLEDCMKDSDVQALTEQLELLPLPQPVRRQLKCTPETAIYESGKLPLRLVRRPKTCLGDAWNLGINIARYPYFACIRAGMQLDAYGLDTLMGPFFQHRDTMATGGSIQKASSARPSSLTTLENLEYDRSIPAMQVLLHSKTLLLFGGPSAYRKDTVIEVGGFPARDDGLDPGLTLTLQRHCRKKGQSCRIVYVPEAKGVLPPSDTFPQVLTRRRSWQEGMKLAMKDNAELLCLYRFGGGTLQYLLFLVFSLWTPLLSMVGALIVLICLFLGLLDNGLLLQIVILSFLFKLLLSLSVFRSRTEKVSLSPRFLPRVLLLWLQGNTLYRLRITIARIRGLFA
ncbi:MAG: glycosyltransferase family 2 protein [Clostridiales bacterium]|nr:glycosyltransferase family 2 protein [Clostridiales bacterium]MDY3780761.1 glycosyltransferase family 2 protein [Candidatus Faecousia sp.]MDY6067177.1 glycosyltransferase family 2 protein [Candidatus Faecousia sp.]